MNPDGSRSNVYHASSTPGLKRPRSRNKNGDAYPHFTRLNQIHQSAAGKLAYASPGGGLPVSSPISPASLAASRFSPAISSSICSVCLAARESSISGFLEII